MEIIETMLYYYDSAIVKIRPQWDGNIVDVYFDEIGEGNVKIRPQWDGNDKVIIQNTYRAFC